MLMMRILRCFSNRGGNNHLKYRVMMMYQNTPEKHKAYMPQNAAHLCFYRVLRILSTTLDEY